MTPAFLFDAEWRTYEDLLPGDGSARLYRYAFSQSVAEQDIATLLDTVPWQQHPVWAYERSVAQPRLVAWFGDLGRRYCYYGLTLEPLEWTGALNEIRIRCEELAGATFNSARVNLHPDARDHVSWHADDEPELGPDPTIASSNASAPLECLPTRFLVSQTHSYLAARILRWKYSRHSAPTTDQR